LLEKRAESTGRSVFAAAIQREHAASRTPICNRLECGLLLFAKRARNSRARRADHLFRDLISQVRRRRFPGAKENENTWQVGERQPAR